MPATPNGPSKPRPAPSAEALSNEPMAPPSPAIVGQATRCEIGRDASTAASSGSAPSSAAIRPGTLPIPRCEPMRHAQASNARPGSTPAMPKPCSSRSDSTAPSGPARLVAWVSLAVFSEGSSGS